MIRDGRTRLRSTATVVGTLLVVVLEMAFLTGVWHLGDALDREREAASAFSAVATSGASTPAALERQVDGLQRSGLDLSPGSAGATAVAAARVVATSPGDARALAALEAADAALVEELDEASSGRAWLAFAIHATLLVGVSIGWFAWFRRIVDRHRTLERELTAQRIVDQRERRLLALVQNSADLIVVIEADSTISFVSPSAPAVIGRTPDELVGLHVKELVGDEAPALLALLTDGRTGDQPVRLRLERADGRTIVGEGTLTNLLGESTVEAWVLTLRDVTEQHELAEQLSHQAFHDALTGLANRALFSDRLEHAIARREGTLAVMFLDLDDFKQVNDTRGHSVGDRLLVVVTDRLRAVLRSGDTAARLGGDEFAVLMEGTDRASAEQMGQRLLEALAQPVAIDGGSWSVKASLGIALADARTSTAEDVLREADVAMYWAKEQGKGTLRVFDAAQHAVTLDRMTLQAELVTAIEQGGLVLHYQPTVNLRTREVTGFEALVRWQHPSRGFLPPNEFIPAAEASGAIVALGSWVLYEACRAAVELQGAHRVTMAVNVSAQQLARPEFITEVAEVLASTTLDPTLLVLEITESVLLDDITAASESLQGLRALGVSIAIDDFGTGYSSLSYLSQLPVDILKVDKSFIDDIIADRHAATVTLAILEMSRSLHMTTVAEGVETSEQAAWLEEQECGRGQGYLWSRPVPLAQARELVPGAAARADEPLVDEARVG
ncbi:EAL domain-containing protein [Arthrobacter sp. NEB 688]|uniref:putative bifunctional diguanylate cyclase/phosphodiesterase n=1 Tax=Arthrobacter sp. NEB 688 TaxID=904039 RepID=UPI001563F05F|nr:EAL domain-containing protein [Arthrobacter sp. NEB 688]QKE82541.1 EAL domain-containing protein [Arthrobacter sp. NEB 688]